MLDSDTMADIIRDISRGTAPEDSELDYDDEMLAFRAETEREFEAFKATNPNAELVVPNDVEGLA